MPKHLTKFFSRYPQFIYNAKSPATSEFSRLCGVTGWNAAEAAKRAARRDFHDALVMQFNAIYGTDDKSITNWQTLCAKLGMEPVPEDIPTCKTAVKRTHVNLVDLVTIHGTNKKPRLFATEVLLSEYTMETEKIFPKENAKAGNILKFLLRNIVNPSKSRGSGSFRK